jgi:signal transduction histidine kinase
MKAIDKRNMWYIKAREYGFFVFMTLIFVGISFFLYQQFLRLMDEGKWVDHTYQVIEADDDLLIKVLNLHLLEQQYINSKKTPVLEDYSQMVRSILPYLEKIEQLTKDNPTQQELIKHLQGLTKSLLASMQQFNKLNDEKETQLIASIDQLLSTMNQNEGKLLKLRDNAFIDTASYTYFLIIFFAILGSLLLMFSFYMLYMFEKKLLRQQLVINRELEAKNELITKVSRLKSDFLANMSHEFHTPLNGIIGFTELMHDEKLGSITAAQKDLLGDILTSSRHLSRLILDILDLQMLETGKMEFVFEKVNLEKLINEVHHQFKDILEARLLQVDVKIMPEINDILIDSDAMKKIIYHFISNAVKFSNEKGSISVRISKETWGLLRIEVEDNGVGIKQEDIEKLFVEFQQLDAGASKRYQGGGLGLALVRRIVESLGGSVGVESTKEKGSVFFVILPYRD